MLPSKKAVKKPKKVQFAIKFPYICKYLCLSTVRNFVCNQAFSGEILPERKLVFVAWDKRRRQTIYDYFLENHREEQYPKGTVFEKHHVVPIFAGGLDDPKNIVRLSPEHHTLAHFYRYLTYSQKGDKVAYTMRINQTNEGSLMRSELAIEANKVKEQLFWDRAWQSKQGKKGGKAAGVMNTIAQQKARSIVGKTYGRKVGVSRQSARLKDLLKNAIIWRHKSGKEVVTNPCNSFKEICDQLEVVVPGEIKNNSSFIKVLYGERKQLYNWKLVSMAIRSEAENGL